MSEPSAPSPGTAGALADAADATAEAGHRELFEGNPHPMWVYDLATLGFIAVNDAAVRQYGWSRDEFLRMSIMDIRPPEDLTRLLENVAASRTNADALENAGAWRHRTRDGRTLEVEISSHRLHFAGRDARLVLAHDVTHRNRIERDLRESEARMRVLFEASPMPTLAYERGSLRLLAVNEAFTRLYGYTVEEALTLRIQDLYPAELRAAMVEMAGRVRGINHVTGIRHVAKDGHFIDVETRSDDYSVAGRSGRISVIVDVTAQRRAEAARRSAAERFEKLFEAAPEAISVSDFQSGRFQQVNDAFCALFGHAREALIGRCADDLGLWPTPQARGSVVARLRRGGTLRGLEGVAQRGDGTTIDVLFSAERIDFDGSDALLLMFRDISQRKRLEAVRQKAEEELRQLAAELEARVAERTAQLAQSEARYRGIFETVPVSISEEDWSGVQALLRGLRAAGVSALGAHIAAQPDFVRKCLRSVMVRRLNRKALALHDARAGSAEPDDLTAFFPSPEDEAQFIEELEAMWSGRRQLTARRTLPSLGGRPLSLMATMSLPGLDDEDGTALICLVDLTEFDRLNEELDQSMQRLRQVNRELETFTYSVSHDLKAPLRGIDGYSRLLLEDHADRLDDEGRRFLVTIRQATRHMGALIDDLLAYSRLERRELTLAPIALLAVTNDALTVLHTEIAAAGAQLELRIEPGLHARGDLQGLTMALRNLLDNALKFSRERTPPRITLEALRSGGVVRLSVRDNGVGFDMKFHDRIFAIFQRLHRAEDYPGTGIGLAIVRKAMERMGGHVWAASAPGNGATFTIELPLAETP